MGAAVRDLIHKLDHVALLDFVNASCTPVRQHIALKQVRYLLGGSDCRYSLPNEGLDQIVDPVDHQAASRLLLLLRWVSAIEPCGKDLLRLSPRHRQRDPPIRADGVFPQSRAGTSEAVHHQEYLTAFGRHFHAKAWKARVPIEGVLGKYRQTINCGFGQS